MDLENLKINFPMEFRPYIYSLVGKTIEEKIRIALALELFLNSIINIETAAAISGQPIYRFAEISDSLTDQGII